MMKIMIPIDGSAVAVLAVHHGLALVRHGLQARFVLANVQAPATLYEMVTAPDAEALGALPAAAGEHLLEGAAALLDAAGVPYEREVAAGEPAHTLIEIVERLGCDAVLLGAERGGTMRRALLGSVGQVLLAESPVPVTLVHPADAAHGEDSDVDTDADIDAP